MALMTKSNKTPVLGEPRAWRRTSRRPRRTTISRSRRTCAPTAEAGSLLQALRVPLRDRLRIATTVGSGREYLHATDQLHKGGRNNGLFIQITGEDKGDLAIPGVGYGFSTLKAAQAQGDLETLRDGAAAGSSASASPARPRRACRSSCRSRARRRGGSEREGLPMASTSADESCVLVIFGASGDLTRRKLVPALWSMFQGRVLPEPFAVVGVGAHPDGQRAVPQPHARGHHRLRPRPAAVVPGVGPLRPGPLLLCRRSRRRRDLPRPGRLRARRRAASAARAATGSSTCRRPRRCTRTWSRGSARRG